jgi:hypothetical protein
MSVAPEYVQNSNFPPTEDPNLAREREERAECRHLWSFVGTVFGVLFSVAGFVIACCFIQLDSRHFVLSTLVCARRMLPDEWRASSYCSRIDLAVMLYLGEGESSVPPTSRAVCGQTCWDSIGTIRIPACANVSRGLAIWVDKDTLSKSGSVACRADPDPSKSFLIGCCILAIGACMTAVCGGILCWILRCKMECRCLRRNATPP